MWFLSWLVVVQCMDILAPTCRRQLLSLWSGKEWGWQSGVHYTTSVKLGVSPTHFWADLIFQMRELGWAIFRVLSWANMPGTCGFPRHLQDRERRMSVREEATSEQLGCADTRYRACSILEGRGCLLIFVLHEVQITSERLKIDRSLWSVYWFWHLFSRRQHFETQPPGNFCGWIFPMVVAGLLNQLHLHKERSPSREK